MDFEHHSIIAIAGPKAEVWSVKKALERDSEFGRVITFDVPDDYGEFPDTSGYVQKNWEDIVLSKEDGNLYGFMAKCMDAAIDFTNKKADELDNRGFLQIEKAIHWPRFGGNIFAATGHVTGKRNDSPLVTPKTMYRQ
jgi:hypothetical protein